MGVKTSDSLESSLFLQHLRREEDQEESEHSHLRPQSSKQPRGQTCNMQIKQSTMKSLAMVAVLACIAIMGAHGQQKRHECCKTVSTENITVSITGFQVQRRNPPCVKAVIFFTTEGPKCSHWRENWVQEKILELRKLQKAETGVKMTETTAAPLTTSSP